MDFALGVASHLQFKWAQMDSLGAARGLQSAPAAATASSRFPSSPLSFSSAAATHFQWKLSTKSRRSLVEASAPSSWSSLPASPDPKEATGGTGTKTKACREIPGDYGPPLLGALRDRLDYFYGEGGSGGFFKRRIQQHGSTVVRVNMPPGPPFFPDSRVVALLDASSFSVLFDSSKVEKRDVFTGTYRPSLAFTGGHRVLSYLDVDEAEHSRLKNFCFRSIAINSANWLPSLRYACDAWLDRLEAEAVNSVVENLSLAFLTRAVLDRDAVASGELSGKAINLWLVAQIAPVFDAGLPSFVQEPLLHTFPVPALLVRRQQNKIVDFFSKNGSRMLALAQEHGISRDEALHNLIFFICFNTHGGFIRIFPAILKQIAAGGLEFQRELREEIRAAVEKHGEAGKLTPAAVAAMPLLHSTIYEVLRLEPPVPSQYGRAKKDMLIESHDEAFRVKKGEMLFGFQPLATRDAVIFDDPQSFQPRRFMGEQGAKLLRHVVWSNGPETRDPTTEDKQCPGKDVVVFIARAFIAEVFLKFDSFQTGPKGRLDRLVKRA